MRNPLTERASHHVQRCEMHAKFYMHPIELRKPWEKVLREAEIEDFRFHDLRHTAASYLAMDGVDMLTIADILGHKTLQMVKRYSHLADEHRANALNRLGEIMMGGNNA